MGVSYSKEFIEELKSKISMVSLANKDTVLKRVGKNIWQGKCPNPNHSDSTPSFTIWEDSNKWICYGCKSDRTYDCIDYVQWCYGFDFQTSVEFLAALANMDIPDDKNKDEYDKKYSECVSYQNHLSGESLKYLNDRGLDNLTINKFKLGYDVSEKRIVFPLISKSNKVVGFIKRTLYDGTGPKYKNSCTSEIFNKSKFLYNYNNIDNNFKYIRITEGTMDAIMATKYGAKNVVATLGVALTQSHVDIIKNSGLTPVIMYDSDNAGVKATSKALELFYENGISCKVCPIKSNKDLCDLSLELREGIEDYILDNSMTYGYALVSNIINAYNKDMYEIRLKYSKKIEKVMDRIPDDEKATINGLFKTDNPMLLEEVSG